MNKKKSNKKAIALLNIFLLILLLIIFIFFLTALYFLYLNIPGKPQFFDVSSKTIEDSYLNKTMQFYPNMKFNHNLITYHLDEKCEIEKQERMQLAFNEISKNTEIISFSMVLTNPDIEVSCSKENTQIIEKDYFIAGEGGAKEIIQTGKYNVITNGIVFLYENPKNSIKCDYPNTEVHELIHVFGFQHFSNPDSLMYPLLESCIQKLDESIIKELKRLYSEENLPDLYFESAKTIKKGKYLDFNITIKNQGTTDAKNPEFSILDNGKLVETKKLEDLKFGAGIFIENLNFKLINQNSREIQFILDYYNKTKELDKTNNMIKLKFNEN